MSTAPGDSDSLPQTTADEIDSTVTAALTAGDTGATQAIGNLSLIHKARVSQLSRTAATAAKQYGADSDQAKAAQTALAAGTLRAASVATIQQQAATPSPPVAATGWALQGRVFNAALQPVENFTVFLVSGAKAFQSQFGFAYTDATGYFLLNYAGPADAGAASQALFVEVANDKSQAVYLGTTAFQPALASTTYQNIVLPAGEKPLGDPPEAVRDIAFPEPDDTS